LRLRASDDPFDQYYFAHCCGLPYKRDEHWLGFFGAIADQIATRIEPRRVLDAGCALGILVETLRARGIDAEGIDISSYAIEQVCDPIKPYCRQGSIAEEFPDGYDLIVSVEVLEHMPPEDGERAIANFCRHTNDVLFSSTPSDHREPTHVNVQPAEYWAEIFARHGFFRDVDFDASFLTPWAVRFRKSEDPLPRIVRNYERRYAMLATARLDARNFATDLQRDHGTLSQRVEALETERDGLRQELEAERAGNAGGRDAMQHIVNQLGELMVAVDHERRALLDSRSALEAERVALRTAFEEKEATLQAALEAARTRMGHQETAPVEAEAAAHSERGEITRRGGVDGELASLRESIEHMHTNLTRKVVALDGAERQLTEAQHRIASLEHDVAHARQTIQLMERSLFWRARGAWVAVKRGLGRPS
jgi:SAM-dependent methyltransferase